MQDVLTRRSAAAEERTLSAAVTPGQSEVSVVDRLKSLSAKIEATKRALEAQEKRLEALRTCTNHLGGALEAAGRRVEKAEAVAAPLSSPKPAVAAPVAVVKPVPVVASRPKYVLPGIEEDERLRTRRDVEFYPETTPGAAFAFLRWAPYAAIAVAALALAVKIPWKALSLKDLRAHKIELASPMPEAPTAESAMIRPSGPIDLPVAVDDQTVDDVLQLVYSHRVRGSRETVIELLGPEIDSSASVAPWMVERGEKAGQFHATLRPYGEALDDAPVYEFDVDLAAGQVRPLPSTELALRGGSVAATGR